MPLNKKLIHFNEKTNFMSENNGVNNSPETPTGENGTYGNLKGTSIVFIKDSKEIGTHGNLYKSVNWSVLEKPSVNLITFTIDGTEYQAEEGMTGGEGVNSKYNVDGFKNEGAHIVSRNNYPIAISYNFIQPDDIISDEDYNIRYGDGGGSND